MDKTFVVVNPKVKYKSFVYQTQVQWLKGKEGVLRSKGKMDLPVASPPEFKGKPGIWTPEDLFIASVESCILMTFAAFAEKSGLSVVSYQSEAEGVLEFAEGGYRFTKITVKPRIAIKKADEAETVKETLFKAHRKCLVSNSINSEVFIEPKIVIE